MSEQTASSISTLTRFFDFNAPEEFSYDIEEIAHALANLCRYTGHVHSFYSVAEHSVLVSLIVPKRYALEGLLHDASEAFCGDVNKPLKTLLPEYRVIEDRIQSAIAYHFGLVYPFPEDIHVADRQVYWSERAGIAKSDAVDKIYNQQNKATKKVEPIGWDPELAEFQFMRRYNEILQERDVKEYIRQESHRSVTQESRTATQEGVA